ncbi:DUF7524 family protein [Halovivax limisalsi]|uniref:DUF7524 family protein n=1 Tax=Halovivax limisalsi TaxID=1453760 RepID=UPI001FFCAD38|nr:hypothetical protein [Halovivax limisalsi]
MSPQTIAVHVDRYDEGAIDSTPPSIETDRSFDLHVTNHGEPVHLHVRADDELADVVSVAETNPYVESGESITIPVRVGAHESDRSGAVELSTRFGANTAAIDLTLTGGVDPDDRVDVDERLASPPDRGESADDGAERRSVPTDALALAGLVVLALVVGIGALSIVDGPAAILGGLTVLAGVLVAGYLLASGDA